jgi:CBS domain containing-hemolysin-like protein
MGVMLLASKSLTRFVNNHPTVVVLCLSFLLMIGLSLIAEGFGFHIPKGYLYAAIGFSILIELFNQIARRNFLKSQSNRPMRERTAEAIQRLMGGKRQHQNEDEPVGDVLPASEAFAEEERHMITGVLTLASRSLRTIMTPRTEISWVDCEKSPAEIRNQLLDTPHSLFPICRHSLDDVIGVVRAKDLLVALENGENIVAFAEKTPPIVVPETMDVINLLAVLRKAKGRLVVVSNEFGVIQGLVTPLDVLEAIAGEFPDEDETPDVIADGESWIAKGGTDLHLLQQVLDVNNLVNADDDFASLAGLLLSKSGQMPVAGEVIEMASLHFEILEVTDYRIERVRITRIKSEDEWDESH